MDTGKRHGPVLAGDVLAFVASNPGCKGGDICRALDRRSCDRGVDKATQELRRAGRIEYRKGVGGGWFAKEQP